MGRVVVMEGVRSAPVSSLSSIGGSIGASWSVFGQPASSPVLPAWLSGRRLFVGREPMT